MSLLSWAGSAQAQRLAAAKVRKAKSADSSTCAAAILVEAQTGKVLFAYNADQPRQPASTQKLLLELVVMDALAAGEVSLDDTVRVSAEASRINGSQVFLREGEALSLRKMMEAVAVASANDACVAVAEHLAGTEANFVARMNAKARELGLEHTHCANSYGLDNAPAGQGNVTTSYELSQIALALLRQYPEVLQWSSLRQTPFREGTQTLHSTNKLLDRLEGMDGLKTGFTSRAGFCLVGTAQRRGMRLVSVVLGARNSRVRERETVRLLEWGFEHYAKVPLAEAGQSMGLVNLDWGAEPAVNAVFSNPLAVVLRTEQKRQLKSELQLPPKHPAPVRQGQGLGKFKVSLGDSLLAEVDLVAEKSVERVGLWERLMSYF
ncbi:MAG: D-alanyl-D-alanine carboxypeptidase [Candidatus Latescibacteria bacterium]|nr:D-alanyl-D-alanine carboxypeptidase [Candidatus Latescibacterota bacterium]